ncbi:MAG: hypothetical protein M3Y21_04020 [Candidatus Eremiobacteraeota bacterium]|nr:hypothetical protein [Candidatus Eremiobacteraeota bacterium]
MAKRAPGNGNPANVKRAKRSIETLHLLSRLAIVGFSLIVFGLVAVQFAHILKENVAMAHSLREVRADVQSLKDRKREQERELRRLASPAGAIPEIHDRLHLVRANEAIIYIKHSAQTREVLP